MSAARTAAASHACASEKCKCHPDSAALRDRSTNAQWGAEAATLLDVQFVTSLSVTTTGTMVAAIPAVNTHVADTYTPPTCISKVCLVVVHQLLQHTHVLQDVDCRSAHSITAVLVCSNRCRRKGAVRMQECIISCIGVTGGLACSCKVGPFNFIRSCWSDRSFLHSLRYVRTPVCSLTAA